MPAVFGPYHINSDTFATASGVWTDSALTTCAPTGFYSNGVIQRYLTNDASGCCLGAIQFCPSCITPPVDCEDVVPAYSGQQQDVAYAEIGLSNSTGVAFVVFNPDSQPDAAAAEYPAGSGNMLTEAVADNGGYLSCNYNGGSSSIWDYAIWIGCGTQYGAYVGVTGGGPGCTGDQATGVWPTQWPGTSNVVDTLDANLNWVPDASITQPQPFIGNYNFSYNMGDWGTTKCGFLGLDPAGVLQPDTSIGGTGCCNQTDIWIPIVKTSPALMSVAVAFLGSYSQGTSFDGRVWCPRMPHLFALSNSILSTPDPAVTPPIPCTTPADYPIPMYQSTIHSQTDNFLGVRNWCWSTPNATGLRINEGGVNYEWYVTNLGNQPPTNQAMYWRGGVDGNTTINQDNWSGTVLIQIDQHGLITRLMQCP